MIEYSAFVSAVGRHLGVDDTAEIRSGIEAVLGAVAQILDADARGRLGAELPGSLRTAIPTAGATRSMSTEELLGVVAALGNYPVERSRYWTQAVLAGLGDVDPAAAEIIAPALPDTGLTEPLGQGPAPRGSGVPTNRQPEILELDEIQRQIAGMPGWTGDEQRLVRTVEIPAERVAPLTDAVHRIETELGHHAGIDNERIDKDRAGLTFTVWTHSLNRVTDLDLQLASRIDEAIRTVA
jgi:pterin-4a-carbinolamine dehydratase